jgi:hypothetical protein
MEQLSVGKLREIAKELPLVFRWGLSEDTVEGHWLNCSAVPELKNTRFNDDDFYRINLPALIEVDHHKELKAVNKALGVAGVTDYINTAWATAIGQGYASINDLPGETNMIDAQHTA